MSVVNVKPKWSHESAGDGRSGPTAEAAWTVLLDAPSPFGSTQAKNAAGIPRISQRHPNVAGLYVTDVNATAAAAPGYYDVMATYGPKEVADRAADNEKPTPWRWYIQTRWVSTTEVINTDIEGNRISNSAGEPFDPGMTDEILDELYEITGWMPDNRASRDLVKRLNNTVNVEPVYGYAPGQGLIRIAAVRMVFGNNRYLDVTAEILFRDRPDGVDAENTWDRRGVDEGYRELIGSDDDGKPIYQDILDNQGMVVSQPVLLDGNGRKLAKNGKTVWIYVKRRRRASWAGLKLRSED